MKKGKLIALEGCAGVGKTTLINKLKKRENMKDFVFVSEVAETEFSNHYMTKFVKHLSFDEDMALPFAHAFMACFCDIDNKIVKPAIEAGKIVITDRWTLTPTIYQGALHSIELARRIEQMRAISNITIPNVYFFVHPQKERHLKQLSERSQRAEGITEKELEIVLKTRDLYFNHWQHINNSSYHYSKAIIDLCENGTLEDSFMETLAELDKLWKQ